MSYLKISQFGKRFNLSNNTVKKYIADGKIESIKIGYNVRIPMSTVERFEQQITKRT